MNRNHNNRGRVKTLPDTGIKIQRQQNTLDTSGEKGNSSAAPRVGECKGTNNVGAEAKNNPTIAKRQKSFQRKKKT